MKEVYVVSDLHMYCRRSQWQSHLPDMHRAASEADLFVFNGDTFDFKWSEVGAIPETTRRAIEFLEDFASRYPRCQFHVNLGNHDHIREFMDSLDALAARTANLSWHPYFLRVGSTIFLHGDAANRKMKHKHLERYRASWMRAKHQGPIKHRMYDVLCKAKAHVAISRVAFTPKRTMRRVAHYLDDIGHGAADGVERVYFGHTHVPISSGQYGGITYHNGGAPILGVEFTLLKAVV